MKTHITALFNKIYALLLPALSKQRLSHYLVISAPLLFLLTWSTGYAAILGLSEYMLPFTAMQIRLGLIILCLYLILWIRHQRFTSFILPLKQVVAACMTGVILHGVMMMITFQAIYWGYPVGLLVLIYAMQPILLLIGAILFLRQATKWLTLCALGCSLLGLIVTILAATTTSMMQGGAYWLTTFLCLIGLAASILGTFLKKYCNGLKTPYIRGLFWQYSSAFIFCLPFYLILERDGYVLWNWQVFFYMAWLVLPSAIGGVLLLLYLLEQGADSTIHRWFALNAPLSVLWVWLLFDARLSPLALAGLAISIISVLFITKRDPHINKAPITRNRGLKDRK